MRIARRKEIYQKTREQIREAKKAAQKEVTRKNRIEGMLRTKMKYYTKQRPKKKMGDIPRIIVGGMFSFDIMKFYCTKYEKSYRWLTVLAILYYFETSPVARIKAYVNCFSDAGLRKTLHTLMKEELAARTIIPGQQRQSYYITLKGRNYIEHFKDFYMKGINELWEQVHKNY